ncbi:MAG: hypothetical protein IPM51_16345 [Sphingobacteriaceae bacterium]|nr:hypothetical protein [Sphingobacteriaceae bacterium]
MQFSVKVISYYKCSLEIAFQSPMLGYYKFESKWKTTEIVKEKKKTVISNTFFRKDGMMQPENFHSKSKMK